MVSLRLPGASGGPCHCSSHMAETIGKRQALIRGILANIVIPQLLLIVMAAWRSVVCAEAGAIAAGTPAPGSGATPRDDLSELDETKAPEEVRPLIAPSTICCSA